MISPRHLISFKFKQQLFILLGILVVVQLLAASTRFNQTYKPVSAKIFDTKQPSEEKVLWANQIAKLGGSSAYKKFKQEYSDDSFSLNHLAAHIFGVSLYEKLGLNGLVVCDDSYSFGCFHGFFSSAIAYAGLIVIPQLNQICLDHYGVLGTACLHGIGHGLMEYFGSQGLIQALDKCSLTTQQNPLFGCSTGVFMEYFAPINVIANQASTQPRAFHETSPYEVCPEIKNLYQKTCYFQIPQWWNRVLKGNFTQIGELCLGADREDERRACFLGTGNDAAISREFNLSKTIETCHLMPDAKGLSLCLAGASWSFLAVPAKASLAPQLCVELARNQMKDCVRDADLSEAKSPAN